MSQKRVWTDEQSLAINTRDRTLLISAAAGAGKTATLTERIIRSLLDEEKPENINECSSLPSPRRRWQSSVRE